VGWGLIGKSERDGGERKRGGEEKKRKERKESRSGRRVGSESCSYSYTGRNGRRRSSDGRDWWVDRDGRKIGRVVEADEYSAGDSHSVVRAVGLLHVLLLGREGR
jgi:hypothetical protein